MYRHIRKSSLEAYCVRIPPAPVISANVIVIETGLYSNKSTLLKPLKLERNAAVMKMKKFKWLGISEKTRNSLGLNSLAKVLHRSVVSKLCKSFLSALPSFLLGSFTKRKQAATFEECKLNWKRIHLMPWCNLTFHKTWHGNNKTCQCWPIDTKYRSPYLPVLFGIKLISFVRSR